MRVVEIRLLDGPNVYALEPTVKLEVAVGRRRPWHGERAPIPGRSARLGARTPPRELPGDVAALFAWVRRLRVESGEGSAGVGAHRASDPDRWVVAYPWSAAERARAIADSAVALVEHGVPSGRRSPLTGPQARLLRRSRAAIETAGSTPPTWIRDPERHMPVVSISGTNGKSTVTRLVTHILRVGGRRVGTTTSDGVYVDEGLVEAGDWTGPGGAAMVLLRDDVEVAVLETARGGILLRGVGYESNDVSVLTNVSSDHLDLQGIHTLPELAEVKATICRMTLPTGRVVLNADDPYVLRVARETRAPVALISLDATASAPFRRHVRAGGAGYTSRDGLLVEQAGGRERPIVGVDRVPIALDGLAGYNVANALAAAAAARGLGVSVEEVERGLRDFRTTADLSPGRLNLFGLGDTVVVVDFAHNEAGVDAILGVARGLAARARRPGTSATGPAEVTAIVGTAGDRPDDTLRGIGRIAASRADRVAVKETLGYLRGRPREQVVAEILAGVRAGGGDVDAVPVYETEIDALRAELAHRPAGAGSGGGTILVLLCHEQREEVLRLLAELGAEPLERLA